MHHAITKILGGGISILILVGAAAADSLEDGFIAEQRGDYAQAVAWFRDAAVHGNARAQFMLGGMYDLGRGVSQDDIVSFFWYSKSANLGYPAAEFAVATSYLGGRGVPENHVLAARWFRKAAEQGEEGASFALGVLTERGDGVAQSFAEALQLFDHEALHATDPETRNEAIKHRDALATRLSSASASSEMSDRSQGIALRSQGGTFVIPITVNSALTLNFMVDSGAAYVSIPEDVFKTLMRSNTILQEDLLGRENFQLADGSTKAEYTFNIRNLQVGNVIIHNVKASIAPDTGNLLLGQSFLTRFKSWSIDNEKHILLLN